MRITKFSNSESDVLKEILDRATKAQPKENTEGLTKIAQQILRRPPQITLRDVFSQYGLENELGTEDVGLESEGLDSDLGGLPEGGSTDLPETETDLQPQDDVTKHLCEALVALCGSVEEAKSCIDQHCGATEGMPDEMDEGMTDEFGETDELGGGSELPEADGLSETGPSIDPNEMPAPMPMQV